MSAYDRRRLARHLLDAARKHEARGDIELAQACRADAERLLK